MAVHEGSSGPRAGERSVARPALAPRLGSLSGWLQEGAVGPAVRRFRELLELGECCLERSHFVPGHFTASAWVVCPERRRLVLIHHRKLGRWLQPGGHIESGDPSVAAAAAREAREETGLTGLVPLGAAPFDLDIHSIPRTRREPEHLHFDVRFAFQATGPEPLRLAPDLREVNGARWVALDEVARFAPEESVARSAQRLFARLPAAPSD